MTAPRIDHYDWEGGREAMLRFGPDNGPVVVVAPPLFEEANRTRAFAVSILRELAARGIGGVLPDIAGQGDSLVPLETLSLIGMRDSYQAVVGQCARDGGRIFGVGIRSGALLDASASLDGRWYLSPQTGVDLLRELRRMMQASGRPVECESSYTTPHPQPVEVAGNLVSAVFLTDLTDLTVQKLPTTADAAPLRIVRLTGDPAPADLHVPGPALWRRAEPATDPDLAIAVAVDIARWVHACEA